MPSTINLYQIGVWFCVGLGNCCSLNCRREHYRTLSHRLPGAAVGDVAACASLGMASIEPCAGSALYGLLVSVPAYSRFPENERFGLSLSMGSVVSLLASRLSIASSRQASESHEAAIERRILRQ
jgi:hypothetical protein